MQLVMDNCATPRDTNSKRPGSPRIRGFMVHLTQTWGSWLNLREVWFSIVERQAIRRYTFTSNHNSSPRSTPSSTAGTDRRQYAFILTKPLEHILTSIN